MWKLWNKLFDFIGSLYVISEYFRPFYVIFKDYISKNQVFTWGENLQLKLIMQLIYFSLNKYLTI